MPNSSQPMPAAGAWSAVLPERLTINEVAEVHGTLHAALARGQPLVIDGGQVAEIDTAGLQLLASLWRSSAAGTPCEWRCVSEPLQRSAQLIGLQDLLRFPAADPGDRVHAPA